MDDDANVSSVRLQVRVEYQELLREFGERNHALQQFMSEEEFEEDQHSWYEPKASEFNMFNTKAEKIDRLRWLKNV